MSMLVVFVPRRFFRLMVSDAKNITRDPMLMTVSSLSIAPAIGYWLGKAAMDDAALTAFGIALFSAYLAPIVLVLPALLIGWVTGFLMLEDRDDGALLALDVTPPGKAGFLAYRVTFTAGVTAVVTLFAAPLVIPGSGAGLVAVVALFVAADAVIAALLLPVAARNKVEGLALTKLINIASLAPLAAFAPYPLRYIAGILPPFWVGEMLLPLHSPGIGVPVATALGVAVHLALIALLFRLLREKAG
ncbi:MAG: hypothetical protein H7X75_09045 [Burkholderiaceae bacterium]|nr:hypothetical protein [Burkholderiaceae bacterium]